jgi:hypothetical protein
MPFPDPLGNPDTPRVDKELFGDLEVFVPHEMGRQKCKAIRVGLRTSCRLDMARGGPEEDVIWQGKVEVRGGTSDDGVILEPGLQRFAFTLIIPGNLAPHDYHAGHRVDNVLWAEVEGVEDNSALSWFARRTSLSSSRGTSPSRMSVSPTRSGSSSPCSMSPPPSLSILRQEEHLPLPPSYDLSQVDQPIPWLSGNQYVERTLILIYNPDPSGGVSNLDTRVDTAASGIGPLTVHFTAEEVR